MSVVFEVKDEGSSLQVATQKTSELDNINEGSY
jgi:hypothetical protein